MGIANIKWVGDIEVSAEPLLSPWNTGLYRSSARIPGRGQRPLARQTLKSAFELAPGASFAARRRHLLTGRSWSGGAPVRSVEVSTDGGTGGGRPGCVTSPGRAAGSAGAPTGSEGDGPGCAARAGDGPLGPQPAGDDRTQHQGYLFDAVVRHPVTVV
ncbi:hypothetical protein ID871_01605 [Streptomyces pratensis]|nr:hypothetical protein [Streptomyces pratensis]